MDCPKHLIYVSDDTPGFTRKRRGRGFSYYDCDGNKISSVPILQRIKALVIPPAWTHVWICSSADGHLQATGIDLKKRKQYIYHPDWVTYRKNDKFEKLASFGKSLPKIRGTVERDLRKKGWPREKVLALIVCLMNRYYFRVGHRRYARENNSYGVTTLRRKHLHQTPDSLIIAYVGKSGKTRKVKINNRALVKESENSQNYQGMKFSNIKMLKNNSNP